MEYRFLTLLLFLYVYILFLKTYRDISSRNHNCDILFFYSVGQLSLAWLHAQGPDVIPIPGTTKIAHLQSNYAALSIELSDEELHELDEILKGHEVKGDRYSHMALTYHGNKK